jgi:hypothetical protein
VADHGLQRRCHRRSGELRQHHLGVDGVLGDRPAGRPRDVSGSSGLQYKGDGSWQFNWKTPTSYAGQCRVMRLNLADGVSDRLAAFEFK